MHKSIIYILLLFLFLYCKKTTTNQNEQEDLPELSAKLTEEQLASRNIKIQEVQSGQFSEELSLIGEVSGIPDKLQTLSARVDGIVKSVHFIEGDEVTKNQLLAVIESTEIANLRSKYFSAFSKYKAVKSNLDRLKELGKLRLAAEQEILNAEAEYKTSISELNATKESLSMLNISIPKESTNYQFKAGLEIRSPSNGIILNRNILPGARVSANTNLGTIGDISELWFMIKIFEKELSKVSEGMSAVVILNSYPDEKFEGILEYIGNSIDTGNRTINGRIIIKNKDRKIKIGLFGRAILKTGSIEVSAVVPESAITVLNNEHYVILEVKRGEYRLQKVQQGIKSDNMVEIKMGLSTGDKVVVSGLYELKSIILKPTFGEDD